MIWHVLFTENLDAYNRSRFSLVDLREASLSGRKSMTQEELEQWQDEFDAFHARFADLFKRSESREQARKYLRGLLTEVERKNSWQVAEAVGDRIPDRMQRLLYRVPWDADAARDRLQEFVIETFGDPEGIGVVSETGFLKKGKKSVGVARQGTGTAGKCENSQVATFLSYVTKDAYVFLDRELYLPQAWAADRARRAEARVPQEVGFASRPQQAMAMLKRAWEHGVPMRWVTGAEIYGDSPCLRETIQAQGRFYVLAVSASTQVWTERPAVEELAEQTGECPGLTARVVKAQMVHEVIATLPTSAWKRLAVIEGERGLITSHWACVPVVESRDQLPGSDVWLLARRSFSAPDKLACYLASAPPTTSLETLVRVASTCSTVEQCIEEARGETGLDEYEVRFWHSWYRHITLSMMAHAWLASIKRREQDKQTLQAPGSQR
jgi:SRSO17 transposase